MPFALARKDEISLSVEEKVASLFQPDVLLADQYFGIFRNKSHLEPEKKLMLAVLEDAVYCFQNYTFARDTKGKALFREAEEWITDKDNDPPFSFENICWILGLNSDYVRRGLLRWKEEKMKMKKREVTVCISRPSRPEAERGGTRRGFQANL